MCATMSENKLMGNKKDNYSVIKNEQTENSICECNEECFVLIIINLEKALQLMH